MSGIRLVLARHGQAHCNVRGIIGGPRGCTGLTDLGRHQVRQLVVRLRAEHAANPIVAAYTTPLRRARESADIIERALAIPVRTMDDLREPDYGTADGQRWSDAVAAFGRVPALHPDQPLAPGAEAWTSYLDRAQSVLRAIVDRHPDGVVLIVGHGETITAAAHLFLNLDAAVRAAAGFTAHYASITSWEQQPLAATFPDDRWRWTLLQHNDIAHLPEKPFSPVREHSCAGERASRNRSTS